MQYSVDTSALVDGWVRFYPPDVFPALWDNIEEMASQNILKASEEVLYELEKNDDELLKWAKGNPTLFAETNEEVQSVAKEILSKFERLVDTRIGRSPADPFVIALAKINSLTVVTAEKPTGKSHKPNIPDVCKEMKIPCITFLQLIRDQKWKFEN